MGPDLALDSLEAQALLFVLTGPCFGIVGVGTIFTIVTIGEAMAVALCSVICEGALWSTVWIGSGVESAISKSMFRARMRGTAPRSTRGWNRMVDACDTVCGSN